MKQLGDLVREHPFFAGLDPGFCTLLGGCARNARFRAGEYLFREGEPADTLFLLRGGRVVLEVVMPGRAAVSFLSLGEGELVGVSWLVPPYRWAYDARASEDTRCIALDARCLRDKCEADPRLGYTLMKRFMPVVVERLQATRLQILDLYGSEPGGS